MKILKNTLLLGTVCALVSLPLTAQVDTGTADFTVYASIGDSLTAGFSSGSLHGDGQALSYPSLISLQARGPVPFEQPLTSDPGIPNVLTLQSLAPLTIAPKAGQGQPLNLNLPGPYDNMAVPGATVGDVVRTRSGGLHDLVLRGLGTQLELVAALQPTFVSVWIGNNDILGAAASGIVIDGFTLTPAAQFQADLEAIVGTMGAIGVQGMAIATLPSVVALPYITTIPPVVINPATDQPVLTPDGQLVWLIGPDGPLGPGDNVLLPASGKLAQGIGIPAFLGGTGLPLSDGDVLSAAETAAVEARRHELNDIIRSIASGSGAAVVDVATIFDDVLQQGITLGGITLTTDLLTGGLFSLDGIHASPIGYAVVANAFIDAINATYGGSIPGVAMADFLIGGLGRLPGSGVGTLAPASGSVIFSAQAERSLRRSLNVPKERKLMRIKKRRERRAGSVQSSGLRESGPSKAERRQMRQERRELRRALRQS